MKGSCHCGAITFQINGIPEFLTECNCSICRRYAGLWAYSEKVPLTVDAPEESTVAYSWGDKEIAFHSCNTCGCTTHYTSLVNDRVAVNCRMCDPAEIASIRVRHFDGEKTWEFLD